MRLVGIAVTLLVASVTLSTSFFAPPVPASTKATTGAADGRQFTIAIIPDTQNEVTRESDDRFSDRTSWLRDNRSSLNLKYVLHTGDMMNWDTPDHAQYAKGSAAMAVLDDASIPWAGAIGNHDTGATCTGGSACPGKSARVTVRDTWTYNAYFPVSRFPGIEGLFEPGKVDNAWSTFSAGGADWLVLTLELWPRPQVVDWAAQVVKDHPDDNVIVVTHSYLNQDAIIDGSNGGYGATSPQYLYSKVVAPNPNVKLVFSGHVGIAGSRVDTRADSTRVASFLGTFHSNTTNPTQLITIDPAADTVSTRFYAPANGQTWPQYETTVTDMQWIRPGVPRPRTVGIRAIANDQIVTAELAGAYPLIANRPAIGPWETFTLRRLDGGNDVALFSAANQQFVCADGSGSLPLIANRPSVGPWETFDLIDNGDGTVSFRSHANGLFVTAESAGRDPLVANRTAVGPWEKFVLS
ncbi:metallophosphoesterase [Nakamurella sp.]|uniref:metallophosphoesterase n=1 Tax=Nakamurella sp. TaxID=1869182 RepID=UPI003B3A07CC